MAHAGPTRRRAACLAGVCVKELPLHPVPLQAVIELVRRRLSGKGDIGDMLADLKEPAEGGEVRGGGVRGMRGKG